MSKKIISLVLAMTLLLLVVATSAYALDVTDTTTEQEETVTAADVVVVPYAGSGWFTFYSMGQGKIHWTCTYNAGLCSFAGSVTITATGSASGGGSANVTGAGSGDVSMSGTAGNYQIVFSGMINGAPIDSALGILILLRIQGKTAYAV